MTSFFLHVKVSDIVKFEWIVPVHLYSYSLASIAKRANRMEVSDMDIDTLIARINELARKKKSSGLTVEETVERDELRAIYLNNIRSNFRQQLDTIEWAEDAENPDSKPSNH